MAKILITGIAGSLAQLTAARLIDEGDEVIGVDYRPVRKLNRPQIKYYQATYNKTLIEDIVRRHKPTHVLHLGRVGNLKVRMNKRFDLNVVGSAKIMELCLKHKVKRLVILSTFHIYGAHPHNHIPIFEDEPLRASSTYPQLADAEQLDNMACTWVYRYRRMRTIVLRPCNVVGPNIRNAISTYLRQPTLFYLAGFSPMWQFIHEADMVDAVVRATKSDEVGIYNVAGASAVPLVEALEQTRSRIIPLPGTLAELATRLGHSLTQSLPNYLWDFLRYPVVVSDARFRSDLGYEPKHDVEETIVSTLRR